jgi:hypothetical protein
MPFLWPQDDESPPQSPSPSSSPDIEIIELQNRSGPSSPTHQIIIIDSSSEEEDEVNIHNYTSVFFKSKSHKSHKFNRNFGYNGKYNIQLLKSFIENYSIITQAA